MAKENVESLCQKAKQAVAKGQNEQARQFFLQALGLRSDSPDVHYGLATVCFLLNDLPSAAYHFKEVTRLDPLRAGAYINLGAIYNRLNQLEDALPALRRGIQLDTNRAEGYYNLGLVYRRLGKADLAIQAYREAVRVNPRMVDAHYNLGNLYLERDQLPLAAAHYRQALELRPNWEKAQQGLEQTEQADAEEAEAAIPKKPPGPVRVDAARKLDPQTQGALLTTLHRATLDSENRSRQFVKVLEGEIEPAIRELSGCLLLLDRAPDLEQRVQEFEAAVTHIQGAQEVLQHSLDRVRMIGEQLLKS